MFSPFFSQDPSNMELILQDMEIDFERADKGLGLSIAGGLGSTPYKNNDEGIFISRVTPNGPADIAGLRKDDKVLSVNQHSCVNIDHYEAVGILKAAGNYINMNIQREVFVQKKVMKEGRKAEMIKRGMEVFLKFLLKKQRAWPVVRAQSI